MISSLSHFAAALMGGFLLLFVRLLTGSQARWWGCPPSDEQRIYFANHQSHADLVLLWAAMPSEIRPRVRAIAAKDYWTRSPFRQWLTTKVFNVVYVDRARQGDEDPLAPLLEALRQGDSVIIFPEGTRGFDGEPQAFKAGLYNLAQQFPQIPLIPIWINNVQRVLPKGEFVPVPMLCSVTLGKPMHVETSEEVKAFSSRARLAVIALRDV